MSGSTTVANDAARARHASLKRGALAALTLSVAAVGAAYASAFLPGGVPGWAAWAFALAMPVAVVALLVLGAARPGRGVGRLWPAFAFVFVVLAAGFGAALLLPPPAPDSPLWLGLPPGAAVMLYGVGLLPLFVLPFAYALTFEEQTLNADDLERVRAAALALRAQADGGERGGAGGPPRDQDDPARAGTPRRSTAAGVASAPTHAAADRASVEDAPLARSIHREVR